jgi:hypothetical protein
MKRVRTTKRVRITKYKKNCRQRKTKKIRGGGDKEQKEKIVKDSFRHMFMKAFKKLQDSIKSGNVQKLNDAVDTFKNGFKGNQLGINTLIPVTNGTIPVDKYKYTSDTTPIIAFVPLLVVIFDNINDIMTRKILTKSFIQNKGNINLQSYTKNISALYAAIKLQDKELIKFLLENGADIKVLTDEQKQIMENLIKEEEIQEIIEKEPEKPIVKLSIPTDLLSDSGYNPGIEPEFWKPVFGENEMITIRQKINEIHNISNFHGVSNNQSKQQVAKTVTSGDKNEHKIKE